MRDTLPQIDIGKPQVFNGLEVSYGIAPILHTLSDMSNRSMRPKWDLFLINVETLIRDRKELQGPIEQIARAVITDCTVLAQYIAMYCQMTLPPNGVNKALVCFYLPHYENLPKQYLRTKFPKGTEERWPIRDKVGQIVTKEGYETSFEDTSVVFDVIGVKGQWPHRDLVRDISTVKKGIQYSKVLLVSHVPSDFHMYRTFNDFTILESYTGALKNKQQLGKKVFQNDVIPFNKYTHLLFGDKWYIGGLLDSKGKREMKQRAEKEHWAIINDKFILESVVKTKSVIPDLLIKPDL